MIANRIFGIINIFIRKVLIPTLISRGRYVKRQVVKRS